MTQDKSQADSVSRAATSGIVVLNADAAQVVMQLGVALHERDEWRANAEALAGQLTAAGEERKAELLRLKGVVEAGQAKLLALVAQVERLMSLTARLLDAGEQLSTPVSRTEDVSEWRRVYTQTAAHLAMMRRPQT